MARRSGQSGYIELKGNMFHVRYRIDVPGQEERSYKSVPICPVTGPGAITKPQRERRAKEIIAQSGADMEEYFNKVVAANLGITFRQQAEGWLHHMKSRKRKTISLKTADTWRRTLDKWLIPNLGDVPLADINNRALKQLVSKMAAAGLSAQSMHNYIKVVKMVVASAVDDDGNQRYPRKWNHEYIDLPEIKIQRTHSFTSEELSKVAASAETTPDALRSTRRQRPADRRGSRSGNRQVHLERLLYSLHAPESVERAHRIIPQNRQRNSRYGFAVDRGCASQ
jgi:hypothetical protein